MFSSQKHSSGQGGFPTKLSHASIMPLKPRFVHFFVRPGGLRARQVSKRTSRTAPRPPKKHLKIHRNHPRIHFGLQCSVSGRPGVRPPTKNDQKWTQNGCKCMCRLCYSSRYSDLPCTQCTLCSWAKFSARTHRIQVCYAPTHTT